MLKRDNRKGETPSFSTEERNYIWKEFLEDVLNCYPLDPEDNRPCDYGAYCDKCKSLDTVAMFEDYISKYDRCDRCHRPRILQNIDNKDLCPECFYNYITERKVEKDVLEE